MAGDSHKEAIIVKDNRGRQFSLEPRGYETYDPRTGTTKRHVVTHGGLHLGCCGAGRAG